MRYYGQLMHNWECRLTLKDPHRQIFPFDWGLEWIAQEEASNPLQAILAFADSARKESDTFFSPGEISGAELAEDRLSFHTPTPTPYPENNKAIFQLFSAGNSKKAVVVIPQWNADSTSHVGLCNLIRRMGITAVRYTLPYHQERVPNRMKRADYLVSPNLGRTLHATRQAVLEVRQAARWLRENGYSNIGIVGTSLGSCVAYLAFTHEPEFEAGVFNHVSSYFADVVWAGLATRYVRWGLEGHVDLNCLRRCWAPLSPYCFVDKLTTNHRPHLMITAKYDLTFLPQYSAQLFDRYRELGVPLKTVELGCGHYSTALFPFKYLDAWHICRFVKEHLGTQSEPVNPVNKDSHAGIEVRVGL